MVVTMINIITINLFRLPKTFGDLDRKLGLFRYTDAS
jgi:hypothetical protein